MSKQLKLRLSGFVVQAALLLVPMVGYAGSPVSEATISLAAFKAAQLGADDKGSVPALRIYNRSGICVGLFGAEIVGALGRTIADALVASNTACPHVVTENLGDLESGADIQHDSPTVQLVVFDVDFCEACNTLRRELDEWAAQSDGYLIQVVKVSFDRSFNPN